MSQKYATAQIGIDLVKTIVTKKMQSGWQGIAHDNDKGIDGIIFLRKKNYDTGNIIFVQVKTGSTYRKSISNRSDIFGVQLEYKKLERWKKYWLSFAGPIILIFVDPNDKDEFKQERAWWVNLRDTNIYSPSNKGLIHIPIKQHFNYHTKSNLFQLSGRGHLDRNLPSITATNELINLYKLSEPIVEQAKQKYKNWEKEYENIKHPIIVNRIGWKHITSKGRSPDRILTSFQLLAIAKKITDEFSMDRLYKLGHLKKVDNITKNYTVFEDFVGFRTLVSYPHRSLTVVQVVLKRKKVFYYSTNETKTKYWFYSVHELRRGHSYLTNNGGLI